MFKLLREMFRTFNTYLLTTLRKHQNQVWDE